MSPSGPLRISNGGVDAGSVGVGFRLIHSLPVDAADAQWIGTRLARN